MIPSIATKMRRRPPRAPQLPQLVWFAFTVQYPFGIHDVGSISSSSQEDIRIHLYDACPSSPCGAPLRRRRRDAECRFDQRPPSVVIRACLSSLGWSLEVSEALLGSLRIGVDGRANRIPPTFLQDRKCSRTTVAAWSGPLHPRILAIHRLGPFRFGARLS